MFSSSGLLSHSFPHHPLKPGIRENVRIWRNKYLSTMRCVQAINKGLNMEKRLNFLSYFEPFCKWCMCRPRPQTTCQCGEETGSTPTSTTRRWMAGCGPTLPRRENTDLYLKRTLDHQPWPAYNVTVLSLLWYSDARLLMMELQVTNTIRGEKRLKLITYKQWMLQ